MPPRIPTVAVRCVRNCSPALRITATTTTTTTTTALVRISKSSASATASYASLAQTPAPSTPIKLYPTTRPPSHKAATSSKTYLHRQYLSLLRSSPLTLVFQHNSLRSTEWVAIRRELANILSKLDAANPEKPPLAPLVKITTIQTGVFFSALRVADTPSPDGQLWSHGTSPDAYKLTIEKKQKHPMAPLLSGPLGVVTFPALAPDYVTATLDMMFPVKRLAAKKGFDPAATAGLQKLLLLGARVQERHTGVGRTLDDAGIRWLSKLKSLEDLRGEIVAILTSVGGGEIVRVLQSPAINLGRTVEGHRKIMEEAANPTKKEGEEAPTA